jgi:uncharacterized membrane-anchored protein YhcB (DUF1043 family)
MNNAPHYDIWDLTAIAFFALIAIGCLVAMVVERWRRRDRETDRMMRRAMRELKRQGEL